MIDFKSILKMAMISLKVNKLRSGLTSLGIIIGVSAVIIMLAVGTGTSAKITKDMESMGSNMFTIRSAAATSGGVSQGFGSRPTLTIKDAETIAKNARGVETVAPVVNETKQLTYGNQNWSSTVYGTTSSYLYIKSYEMDYGRQFIPEDIQNSAKVTVLGSTVAKELFGDLNPINKVIRVGGIPFKVIGVLKSKGQSGPMDNDDLIFIPITTAQKKVFGTAFPGTVKMIVVKTENADIMTQTENDINEILRMRHHIGKNQIDDYTIRNSADIQERLKSSAQTFAVLLFAIASVSLIVGGIGIMNIMLVSVTERTKEIGIRMAIGAKASDIRLQFLIESFILSIFGGIVGVVVGLVVAKAVDIFSNMTIVVSAFSIILSLGFSGLIGIAFGYYPAYKASLLNPIDALRYE